MEELDDFDDIEELEVVETEKPQLHATCFLWQHCREMYSRYRETHNNFERNVTISTVLGALLLSVFVLVLGLQIDHVINVSWSVVFIPIWILDLAVLFCILKVVYDTIALHEEEARRQQYILTAIFSVIYLFALIFQYMLVSNLESLRKVDYECDGALSMLKDDNATMAALLNGTMTWSQIIKLEQARTDIVSFSWVFVTLYGIIALSTLGVIVYLYQRYHDEGFGIHM